MGSCSSCRSSSGRRGGGDAKQGNCGGSVVWREEDGTGWSKTGSKRLLSCGQPAGTLSLSLTGTNRGEIRRCSKRDNQVLAVPAARRRSRSSCGYVAAVGQVGTRALRARGAQAADAVNRQSYRGRRRAEVPADNRAQGRWAEATNRRSMVAWLLTESSAYTDFENTSQAHFFFMFRPACPRHIFFHLNGYLVVDATDARW